MKGDMIMKVLFVLSEYYQDINLPSLQTYLTQL